MDPGPLLAFGSEPLRADSPRPESSPAPPGPVIIDDPTLFLSLAPGAARVSMDAGDAGRVSVQVRLHEGVADVRATGPAAPQLAQHQAELQIRLAQEGLSLGSFSHSGGQHTPQPAPELPLPSPRSRPASAVATVTTAAPSGSLHVRA